MTQVDHNSETKEGHTVRSKAGRVPRAHGPLQAALCSPLYPGTYQLLAFFAAQNHFCAFLYSSFCANIFINFPCFSLFVKCMH